MKWLLKKLGITSRQWKQRKRQELREIIKAADVYKTGCAYCPSYSDFNELERILNKMKKSHSIKERGN